MARRPFDGRSLTSSRQCNGLRPDSTGSSTSRPRCTATQRGFFVETFRADTRAALWNPHGLRPGQPLALPPGHAARHPLPDASRPGQARARGAGPGVRRRRRPAPRLDDLRRVGGRRARRRERRDAVDPRRVRPRLPRPERGRGLRLQVHELLRPGDRGGHPLRRSRGRHRVAVGGRAAVFASATRPRRCSPRSRTRCRSRCERAVRTLPHGRPAPRQPAHRAARVAVRALGGLVVRGADRGPRHGPRAAGAGRRAAGRSGRDRARLGRAGARAVRARGAYYERRSRGCPSTSASARGRRSARACRPRTGRSGSIPGRRSPATGTTPAAAPATARPPAAARHPCGSASPSPARRRRATRRSTRRWPGSG